MTLNEAFSRLEKDGAFIERNNGVHTHWYWHSLKDGHKIMACRNLDGNRAPILYYEFHVIHVNNRPLRRLNYF